VVGAGAWAPGFGAGLVAGWATTAAPDSDIKSSRSNGNQTLPPALLVDFFMMIPD
jgi:hypothetical protein